MLRLLTFSYDSIYLRDFSFYLWKDFNYLVYPYNEFGLAVDEDEKYALSGIIDSEYMYEQQFLVVLTDSLLFNYSDKVVKYTKELLKFSDESSNPTRVIYYNISDIKPRDAAKSFNQAFWMESFRSINIEKEFKFSEEDVPLLVEVKCH